MPLRHAHRFYANEFYQNLLWVRTRSILYPSECTFASLTQKNLKFIELKTTIYNYPELYTKDFSRLFLCAYHHSYWIHIVIYVYSHFSFDISLCNVLFLDGAHFNCHVLTELAPRVPNKSFVKRKNVDLYGCLPRCWCNFRLFVQIST